MVGTTNGGRSADLGAIPQSMAEAVGEETLPPFEDFQTLRQRLQGRARLILEAGYNQAPDKFDCDHDEYSFYRYVGAAFRPDIPPETVAMWCCWRRKIALSVVCNPEISLPLLRTLAANRLSVRRVALRHPRCNEEIRETCRRAVFARLLKADRESELTRRDGGIDSSYRYSPFGFDYEEDEAETEEEPGDQARTGTPEQPLEVWGFARFIALLKAPEPLRRPRFQKYARSAFWEERLAAALAIDHRPNGRPPRPEHRVLLERLAGDGNSLVRAAAKGRLEGEPFEL